MRSVIPVLLVLTMAALMVLAGCPSKPPAATPPDGNPPIPVAAGSTPAPATGNATAAETTVAADPKVLLETKCKLCHSLEKATSEKLDQAGWQELVKEMAAKKAGWISDTEAAAITEYAVATYCK